MRPTTVAALLRVLLPDMGIRHLLVCSTENLDEAFLEYGSDFFDSWRNVYLGIVELSNTEFLAKYVNDGRRIGIFCTNFPDDRKHIISRFGLGENVFWFVDASEPAHKELRLDSNWITLTEDRVKEGPVRFVRLGVWKENKGFVGQWPPPFIWERRSNLSGVTLVDAAVSFSWPPMWIHQETPPSVQESRGFFPSMKESLKEELNFDHVLTLPEDDQYGALTNDANGSLFWSGMIGQLSRNEADTSFGGLTMTAERATASDFTLAVLLDPFTVGIRDPEVLDPPSTRVNMDVYIYTGNITSYMTSVPSPIPVGSLRELESSHYSVWVRKGSSQEAYLRSQVKAKGLQKLDAQIKGYSFNYSPARFITSDKSNAIYGSIFTNTGDNEIKYLTPHKFDGAVKTYLSVALRKDSELRPLFNHQILKLTQSGALHHLRRRWIDRGSPGDASRRIFHQDSFPLGFDNLFFPALVILSGGAGAAAVLLGEKCRRRIQRGQ